jgi:carbohydrate-binding DOMON domain-containing protein
MLGHDPLSPLTVPDASAGPKGGGGGAAGRACCVAVNVAPAIVSEPDLAVDNAFAATANLTSPLPVPAATPVIVNQSTVDTLDQAQSGAVRTWTVASAAFGPKF